MSTAGFLTLLGVVYIAPHINPMFSMFIGMVFLCTGMIFGIIK